MLSGPPRERARGARQWPRPPRRQRGRPRRAWSSNAGSRARACTPTTSSSGSGATRSSAIPRARPSSSAASSSPRAGPRTRPTSSPRSTSAASPARPSARAPSARWSTASPARISGWGREGGYFATDDDADAFEAELTSILVNQKAAFNSPVWFNVGWREHPQCSACFILSVQDDMESILGWNTKEGIIFKGGSGSGINLSKIRGSEEAALQGRHRLGPRLLHARRRLLGRRDQVRRRHTPRREDGRARRRPPGHREVHLVQGRRGEEGRRPARRRLRHAPRLRGVRLDPVPEREQLGAGHRRVHAGGRPTAPTGSLVEPRGRRGGRRRCRPAT